MGVVSFMLLPLYTRGKGPGAHWIGGCVGSRAGLDIMEKNLTPTGDQTLAVQPESSRYID
jgi:hypothetical protein